VGAVYYHIRAYDDSWGYGTNFTQNATSQNSTSGPTEFVPANFLLGALDGYHPFLGETGMSQTTNWWGLYGQDQWQVTKSLALTAGLRWDYLGPTNFHKVVSGLDVSTGTFVVTQPLAPCGPGAGGPVAVRRLSRIPSQSLQRVLRLSHTRQWPRREETGTVSEGATGASAGATATEAAGRSGMTGAMNR
jgi:outer membrane receptor protein involved in Fe transport